MAIYLGQRRVSPTLTKTVEKVITITNTQDLQGNIISTSQTATLSISGGAAVEDPDNLTADLPVVTEWTRPSGWPNLDALPALTEGVYLTYDNRSTVDYKWACFYCDIQSNGLYTVAQGHMNGNTWVQDTAVNVNHANYKEINYGAAAPANTDYVVFKITPTTATKHIGTFYFGRVAAGTIGTIVKRPQQANRCLERRGWLPYVTTTTGSGDDARFCTEWMQHDNIEFGNSLTSLAAAWYRGRSLKKIEFGNWTGANCNITTLDSTFALCNAIEKIDLSLWDTHGWHITSINSMFSSSFNLKICIVPFNTTSWGNGADRTLTMYNTWGNCHCLETLDLNYWNMSGIKVTRIDLCWNSCYHLKSLNVKNWDTSRWTCNGGDSLYRVFYNCRRLVDIDLSNWVTTSWIPNRMDGMFFNNLRRRTFDDIKNWNTTNWKIKLFNETFASCFTVLELDLRNWNTSNWIVSTLYNTFGNMYSVRAIRVGTWNTTNWNVTNIHYMFLYDNELKELDCWNWNTTNWHVTDGGYYMFISCYNLEEIDFTHWNTTNWNLTSGGKCDIRCMFAYCYNLKKINFSNWNLSLMNSLNYYSYSAAGSRSYSPFYYCFSLQELTIPNTYAGHIDLTELYLLPRQEIIKVFNALVNPPIADTAKVWIYGQRYKLTTADIAIATGKGYTVVET